MLGVIEKKRKVHTVKPLPAAVRGLLASVTDTYTVLTEHSRPGTRRASVWEIASPSGDARWFAKQHADPRVHRREVDAYGRWVRALGPDRAPSLVAADDQSLTILVTAVSGQSLDRSRLPAEQEHEAYRQAGVLLARLHAADTGEPRSEAVEEDWGGTVAKVLDAAARFLTTDDIAVLRAVAHQAPPPLSKVVAHVDYMPRNWMWDEREQQLRVVDFERTQLEPATRRDLSRLHYRVLHHQPEVAAAFYSGYGWPLSAEEEAARTKYAVLDALDAVRWGVEHRDIDLVDEAHAMIASLRAEHTRRTVRW
ncbi:aminoglycoside phosphotransferase family protein [Streptomyces sp. st77]|uniref:aminoglycoside phosphotransferase family protein n=1 Tax=Streptomyces sp. st77 TaxID=1828074 RepID=UPI00211D2BDE|nr:aminoglycoside phosphotransferase family protein [Streptomyces sp. st77]